MKLKLTKTEAKAYVLKYLGLPEDTEVVIVEDQIPRSVPANLTALIQDINKMDYGCGEKIPAIKRFREVVACGLAEAKWAVEHWKQVESFMIKNRCSPLLLSKDTGYILK